MSRRAAVGLARIGVIVGSVLLLELLCRTGIINPLTLLAPSAMASALAQLLWSGEVNHDIAQTFSTVGTAFGLAVVCGLVLGAAIHALPRVRRALDPLLASYYSIPFFVFYPLLVAVFGLNAVPLMVLGFSFACPAVILSTLNGLDRVPRVLLKTARMHRLGGAQTTFLVTLPSAAPYLFTGMKLALAYAFIGVIAGEFILAGAGLGHAIAYAYEGFDNQTMYALMLFILVTVLVMNAALHMWEQRMLQRRGRA